MILYDPKPNSPKNIGEEQTMPDVETSLVKEKNQTTTNEKEKTLATIHDSSLKTSLSQEQILSLKIKNPTEALKRL